MLFRGDFHIHTDFDPVRNYRHGEKPELIAKALVDSQLDVVAITEHNKVTDRTFQVKEEISRLTEGTNREIAVLFGAEISVTFQRYLYHVGYVFEEHFGAGRLPVLPDPRGNVYDLEDFRKSYKGVAILNHPCLKNNRPPEVTTDFLKSGLMDGVEILNGSVLSNGASPLITQEAFDAFLKVKRDGMQLAPIGCSDTHRAALIGSVWTEYNSSHPMGIFHAIRSGYDISTKASPAINRKLKPMVEKAKGIGRYVKI